MKLFIGCAKILGAELKGTVSPEYFVIEQLIPVPLEQRKPQFDLFDHPIIDFTLFCVIVTPDLEKSGPRIYLIHKTKKSHAMVSRDCPYTLFENSLFKDCLPTFHNQIH